MVADLEAAVAAVAAASAAGTDPAGLEDPDPVGSAVRDPVDSGTIPIIPPWAADGIGTDPVGITAAVAAWAVWSRR